MTIRHSPRPQDTLTGLWLQIVQAIDDGTNTLPALVDRLIEPGNARGPVKCHIRSSCSKLCRLGLIGYGRGEYVLTDKGREQMQRSWVPPSHSRFSSHTEA